MLRGTLADFSLQEILWLLSRCAKTGRLTVTIGSVPNHVYFWDGRVYAVESSFSRDGLGSRLVREDKLSEDDLDRALDYCAEHGESLESVLYKWRLVTPQDLDAVVRKQIREVMFLLLNMDGDQFVFEGGLQVLSPRVLCDVADLVKWSSEALASMVPVLRPHPTTEVPASSSITFTLDEWRMVSLINGSRSVEDIGEELGKSQDAVIATLRKFVSIQVVALLEARESEPARPLEGAGPMPPEPAGRRRIHRPDFKPPLPPAVIDVTDEATSRIALDA